MGHPRRLRILVVHNRDFVADEAAADDPERASRADVENAARDVARALAARGHAVETRAVPPDALAAVGAAVDIAARRRPTSSSTSASRSAATPATRRCCRRCSSSRGVRYTGSGPLALATALRKDRTKALLRAHDVPTPAAAVSIDGTLPRALPPLPLHRQAGARGRLDRHLAALGGARRARSSPRASPRCTRATASRSWSSSTSKAASSTSRSSATATTSPRCRCTRSTSRAMPAGAPHIVTYDGKWDPDSQEYKGTRSIRAEVTPERAARAAPPPRAPPSSRSSSPTTRASTCASPPTARPTSSTSTPTAISPTVPASAARPRSAGSPIPI